MAENYKRKKENELVKMFEEHIRNFKAHFFDI